MIALSAATASELFAQAVRAVLAHGERAAPRGLGTREVIGAHLCLTRPRCRLVSVPPVRVLNPAFAAAETVWILSGSDADWIYTYNRRLLEFADEGVLRGAYGPRLRRWSGHIDQLDHVRTMLEQDPATRRAVIQLYDPGRDHPGHKDVPCTLGYRFYLRSGRLDMHTTMRSQDLWLGFCYDIFAATVLHELVAGWVGAELGTYHHHVDSLHLYGEHLPLAQGVPLEVEPSATMPPLAIAWERLDGLLSHVVAGQTCGHAGWQQFAEVMCSYRVWKAGDHPDARRIATQLDGPLTDALLRWYDQLERAATPAYLARRK